MSDRTTVDYVRDCVEWEGLHYAMVHYSDFSEVESEEFHDKRKAFVKASRELAEFLGVEE